MGACGLFCCRRIKKGIIKLFIFAHGDWLKTGKGGGIFEHFDGVCFARSFWGNFRGKLSPGAMPIRAGENAEKWLDTRVCEVSGKTKTAHLGRFSFYQSLSFDLADQLMSKTNEKTIYYFPFEFAVVLYFDHPMINSIA